MTKQFDLDAFIAFVAGKPADEVYDPLHSHRCALAQFGFRDAEWGDPRIPEGVYLIATSEVDDPTFGALHKRLTAIAASQSRAEGSVL